LVQAVSGLMLSAAWINDDEMMVNDVHQWGDEYISTCGLMVSSGMTS
jgi:hypothetical protein